MIFIYIGISIVLFLAIIYFTSKITLKFTKVRYEGFNFFIQYILDVLYFSRLKSPYLIKKRFYIPITIGYLISAIAFIGTILSFVVSENDKTKLFVAIIFTILLIATILYDKLAKKTNDLIENLHSDTKDLIYAYDELKAYEINRKFKKVFEDFTRYTSGIIGVQVYNYHLLSNKHTESIKIEYEFGSVSEGASLNAILQEYYEYDRATKDALIRANRKIQYIETQEDIKQVLKEMDIIEKEVIKSDYSPASVAFYTIFLEELLYFLEVSDLILGEGDTQNDNSNSIDNPQNNSNSEVTTTRTNNPEFNANDGQETVQTAYDEVAATRTINPESEANDIQVRIDTPNNIEDQNTYPIESETEGNNGQESNNTEDTYVNENPTETQLVFDASRIQQNYKNGLFKSVVYSDIIKKKEVFSFTYKGQNQSKLGRSYLFFKATTIKGETKLFLIVIKPEDLLIKKGMSYENFVLEKFISMLSAHELIDSELINHLKGGTVYDTTKRYGL